MYTIAVCDKVSATSIIEDYENRLTTYQHYKRINLNEIVLKDVISNITEDKSTLKPQSGGRNFNFRYIVKGFVSIDDSDIY